jgi:LmbE family N-acetylglucosaminyl deacetylase
MTAEPCVVLSPHLDDAVLSAWHVLSAPREVTVVTVFAGVPEPGFVTDLDRAHGAAESAAWLARRRREDRTALALAGRTPVHLDLLDVQFPAFGEPGVRNRIAASPDRFVALVSECADLGRDPDELAELISARIAQTPVLYGPAGIGGHPDHRDLALATLRLAGPDRSVRLYADSPYYLARGLPSWLAGTPNPAADALTGDALDRLGLPAAALDRQVCELSEAELGRKQAAMRCYRTEFPAIRAELARSPAGPDAMRDETWWAVGGAAG